MKISASLLALCVCVCLRVCVCVCVSVRGELHVSSDTCNFYVVMRMYFITYDSIRFTLLFVTYLCLFMCCCFQEAFCLCVHVFVCFCFLRACVHGYMLLFISAYVQLCTSVWGVSVGRCLGGLVDRHIR